MQLLIRGLRHRFPRAPFLFPPITFMAEAKELVAVTGPSGSGKSTLLSILAGWTTATEGTVERVGVSSITWVPQNPFGIPARSVIDHAAFPLIAHGYSRSDADVAARRALDRFGIAHTADRRYSDLSGGEGQRLMLARSTLTPAQLVLVDEPTAQLDPVSAEAVIGVVQHLADEGRIVFIATHDPRLSAVCPRKVELGIPP